MRRDPLVDWDTDGDTTTTVEMGDIKAKFDPYRMDHYVIA